MVDEVVKPDLRPFETATTSFMLSCPSRLLAMETHMTAQVALGIDPRAVPVQALQAMGTHPAVYLAERTISGIVRRPDLYTVVHDDPAIVAETYRWLTPILSKVARAAARAFAYGACVSAFNWVRGPLSFKVSKGDGKKSRRKRLPGHTRYSRAFELSPAGVLAQRDSSGGLVSVSTGQQVLGVDRVHLWVWDGEFEDWVGQGARRRAWRYYLEDLVLSYLESRYLERSVDSPRVGYAPAGEQEVKGVSTQNAEILRATAMGLRGGGYAGLPGARDEKTGQRLWELSTLDVPPRQEVWDRAIGRRRATIMLSYLVSPGLGGLEDLSSGAGKTLDSMLREFVEDLGEWIAEGMTAIVAKVHSVNHDPEDVEPPVIAIADVGKAQAKKALLTLLQLASQNPLSEVARKLNVPVAIDKAGGPVREDYPEGMALAGEGSAPPGRPRDPSGAREERRDDAATVDGEDATGATDESDAAA